MLNWIAQAMKTLVNILGGLLILGALITFGTFAIVSFFLLKIALIGGAAILFLFGLLGTIFHKDR